jgi:hypothetical protein
MTAATAHMVSPSDTTIPGLTRRRIWTAPEVTSHSVLVLTLPRIYLAPDAGGPPRPDFVKALETAPRIETTLGPLATVIDMTAIRRVRLDLPTNTLTIEHQSAYSKRAETSITFATSELADAVFTKLWRRLGLQFELHTNTSDTWVMARVPLVFMASVFVFTGLFAITLNALMDITPGQSAITRVLPNWQLVCGVGGALVAAGQVWLYRRVTRPPERLELRML